MLIQPNRLQQKLQNGEPAFGVISTSDDPQLAELFGLAGFDYYVLDAEHGLPDPHQAVNVIRACERANMTPLIRLGPKDPKLILPYLDAGMMGVIMPDLRTPADVRRLVEAVKYPPMGRRGAGVSRASGYMAYSGTAARYIEFSNQQTLVIPQFEDASLLPHFAEIFAQPHVDGVLIGPRDLSLNMGFADGPNHPEVQHMIDSVLQQCRHHHLAAGITAANHAEAQDWIARGAKLILGIAQVLILNGAKTLLAS